MKQFLRQSSANLLGALARPFYGGIGCILCLHRVLPEEQRSTFPANRALEITPGDLRAILEFVRARGMDPIALDAVPERLAAPRGPKFIAFSFDDGYRDNLEHALPIFREFGMPFTVNITTGFIDGSEPAWWYALEKVLTILERIAGKEGGRDFSYTLDTPATRHAALETLGRVVRELGPGRRTEFIHDICQATGVDAWRTTRNMMMTREELRQLAAEDLVTIGSHTVAHYTLNRLSDDEARHEMLAAKSDLETLLARPVNHFAYPFGGRNAVGAREFQLARECGFATAVTTRSGNLFPEHAGHSDCLPRLGVSGNFPAIARLRKLESGLAAVLEGKRQRVVMD